MTTINKNEQGFAFITFYSGSHDYIKTQIWINKSLLPEVNSEIPNELNFPVKNATIVKTEKGNLVMKPETDSFVYYIQIKSGFRGSAEISAVEDGEIIAKGQEYHSGQGRLGENAWAVVNSKKNRIRVTGRKTGRRIDKEEQDFYINSENKIEKNIDDLKNML